MDVGSKEDFKLGKSYSAKEEEFMREKINFNSEGMQEKEKEEVYKYVLPINEDYTEDVYLSFTYDLKNQEEVSDEIEVNGKSYKLSDEILLQTGINEIDIPKDIYIYY